MTKEDIIKAKDVLPRMQTAMEILITGEGDSRNRLNWAMYNITPLRPEDFPDIYIHKIRRLFNTIGDIKNFKLDKYDVYIMEHDGTYAVYFKKIKNKTASKYIRELLEIYNGLLNLLKNEYNHSITN